MSKQDQAVAEQGQTDEATAKETTPTPAGSEVAQESALQAAEAMHDDEAAIEAAHAIEAEVEAAEPIEAEAAVETEAVIEAAAEVEPEAVMAAAEAIEADAAVETEAVLEAAAEVEPEVAVEAAAVMEFAEAIEAEAAVETEAVFEAAEVEAEVAVEAAAVMEFAEAIEAEAVEPAPIAREEGAGEEDEGKRVVRVLSVGQPVMGTVRRITDFGAFVDIGVGRDGLVHISELSARRVGKVSDVLVEGQEVQTWIKKLDRERNRISLTLIDPGTKTIRDLEKGNLVHGTVTRMMPYGAFVDIGIGRDALLHVREMGERYVAKPEDVVKIGEVIEARVIEVSRRRGRVDLSIKGLREESQPEPIPEPVVEKPAEEKAAPEPAAQAEDAPDQFAEMEVLTPMQLAFKRAMEAEGIDLNVNTRKQNKRSRRDMNRSIQDEIIARTLGSPRK